MDDVGTVCGWLLVVLVVTLMLIAFGHLVELAVQYPAVGIVAAVVYLLLIFDGPLSFGANKYDGKYDWLFQREQDQDS